MPIQVIRGLFDTAALHIQPPMAAVLLGSSRNSSVQQRLLTRLAKALATCQMPIPIFRT